MANAGASPYRPVKYVHELPYKIILQLCSWLDVNNKWKELGSKFLKFEDFVILQCETERLIGRSPTEYLLRECFSRNIKVVALFDCLYKMRHVQAMEILKPCVDSRHHSKIEKVYKCTSPMDEKCASANEKSSSLLSHPYRSVPHELHITSNDSNQSHGRNEQVRANGNCQREDIIWSSSSYSLALSSNSESHEPLVSIDLHNRDEKTSVKENCPTEICNFGSRPVKPLCSNNYTQRHNPRARIAESSPTSKVLFMSDFQNSLYECICDVFCRSIPLDELKDFTNEQGKRQFLGKGAFGEVTKAHYKNTTVAVKILKPMTNNHRDNSGRLLESFMKEIRFLWGYQHPNILPLLGYSVEGGQSRLIYQFMPNGSLESRLQCEGGTTPITWHQRIVIAQGMAKGLQFLHSFNPRVIHGDFKSANVLLDCNFVPKLGDFGLAREFHQVAGFSHTVASTIAGSRAYLPDEYLRSKKLSVKVDTFGFGVVLCEMATGLQVFDPSRKPILLRDYCHEAFDDKRIITLDDPKAVLEPGWINCYQVLIDLGISCSSRFPRQRPEMADVLNELKKFIFENHINDNRPR